MKLNKFICIISVFSVLLMGCDNASNKNNNSEKHIYRLNETIKTNEFEVTATNKYVNKTLSDYNGTIQYTADGIFLNIDIVILNIGKNSKTIDEGDFYIECDGKNYAVTSSLGMSENKGFFYETINPGIKVNGTIHFDVPDTIVNSPNLKLYYENNEILLNK